MILLSLTSSLSHLHSISVILASMTVQMDAKCGLSYLYLKMSAIFSVNTKKSGYQGNKARSPGPLLLGQTRCLESLKLGRVVVARMRNMFSRLELLLS